MKNTDYSFTHFLKHSSLIACLVYLTACSTLTSTTKNTADKATTVAKETDTAPLKARTIPKQTFEDLLIAEFAIQRNQFGLALDKYLNQAKQTRDPKVAQRATQLAQHLRSEEAFVSAAKIWGEVDPSNNEAQFTSAMTMAKSDPIQAFDKMAMVLNNGGKTNFPAIFYHSKNSDHKVQKRLKKRLNNLLADHKKNEQLWISKALLAEQQKQWETAILAAQKAQRYKKPYPDAILLEAHLHEQNDDSASAIAALAKAVKKQPENTKLRLQYAKLLINKDILLSQQQFEILHQQQPYNADFLTALALCHKEQKNYPQAKAYLEKAIQTSKNTDALYNHLAAIAIENKQWDVAINELKQIKYGAYYNNAIQKIVSLYIQENRLTEASQFISEKRKEHPKHSGWLLMVETGALRHYKHYQSALNLLNKAILASPNQTQLLFSRGMVHSDMQNNVLMEKDFRQILRLEPQNAAALNALGYSFADQNRNLAEAKQMIEQAHTLKPNDPAITDSLGWLEYRLGNNNRALELLEKAYKNYPDGEIAAHYGELLWVNEQQEKAQEIWKKALTESPEHKVLLETLKRLNPSLLNNKIDK